MKRYDVVLRAVSAVCFPPDAGIGLRPGPKSTEPILFIGYHTDFANDPPGELVCHVQGEAQTLDDALRALGNSGLTNIHGLSVAANAAILEPHHRLAYEPSPGGNFSAVETLERRTVAARRVIDVERAARFIEALDQHPAQRRLRRAAENYTEALRRIGPGSNIHAMTHLFFAVESLTEVVANRLKSVHGLDRLAALAEVLGVTARKGETKPRDSDIRGVLRRTEIFDGDDDTLRDLKRASDGLEHGFLDFAQVRALADNVFDRAAVHVRRTILRESGLDSADVGALMEGIHARPLPAWPPVVVVAGTFADDDYDYDAEPVDLRVTATIEIESVNPDEHATEAEFNIAIHAARGPRHRTESMAMTAPGVIKEDATTARSRPRINLR